MFTITGILTIDPSGRARSLTWNNGSMTGDQRLVYYVASRLKALEGVLLGPEGGPQTIKDHVHSAETVSTFVLDLMRPSVLIEGDIPVRPKLPADGIG